MAEYALLLTCFIGGIGIGMLLPVSTQQEAGQEASLCQRPGALVEYWTNNVTGAQGFLTGKQLHFHLYHLLS